MIGCFDHASSRIFLASDWLLILGAFTQAADEIVTCNNVLSN